MTERRRSEVPQTALGFHVNDLGPEDDSPEETEVKRAERAVTGEPIGGKRTLVLLEVFDDDQGREWWEGMGLPDPALWSHDEAFDGRVYVEAHIERVVQ